MKRAFKIFALLALVFFLNTPSPSSATVSASNKSVSYACDGATATYSVNYPFISYAHLVVTATTGAGVVTTLAYTTNWTINATSTTTTATLTLLNAAVDCPSGSTLKIDRTVPLTQPYGFRGQTTYTPSLHERAYDNLEMQIQQVDSKASTIIDGGVLTDYMTLTTAQTATGAKIFQNGLTATGSPTSNKAGVTSTGNGTGAGAVLTGGSSGNGVTASANTTAHGGVFTGGSNGGRGVVGTGGGISGSGAGGYLTGGSPNGNGVTGLGTGAGNGTDGTGGGTSGAGAKGTGGTPNGVGVQGQGTGTGAGGALTGGASNGNGVQSTGIGNGAGGVFVGGGTFTGTYQGSGVTSNVGLYNSNTVGSIYGVYAEGGGNVGAFPGTTGGVGLYGRGGNGGTDGSGVGGVGVYGQGGTPSVSGTGGYGVYGVGGGGAAGGYGSVGVFGSGSTYGVVGSGSTYGVYGVSGSTASVAGLGAAASTSTGGAFTGGSGGGVGVTGVGGSAAGRGGSFANGDVVNPTAGTVKITPTTNTPTLPLDGDLWFKTSTHFGVRVGANNYFPAPLKVGTCTLGTNCAAIALPNPGMLCTCSDTAGINACRAVVAASSLAITGTGTNLIAYICALSQ